MNRIAALMLVGILLAGLCAAAVAEEWTFERGITIVCPWGLGGGADSTIRPISELLEEYLGVPVEVRNETGGSGVDGMCLEIATAGLALNPVPYNSGDEANSDMAEGNVDLSVGGYDDMLA